MSGLSDNPRRPAISASEHLQPRVLHLIGSFHQGGSERQALQLARLLRIHGRYRVYLACLSRQGVLRSEAEAVFGAIPEYALTSFFDLNLWTQLRRFARMLCTESITIVQTHDFYTNVFGMAGAALARVPTRIAAKRETDGVRTSAQRLLERQAYRLAHRIVVNAAAVGEHLVGEGVPRKKILTVHNGLDFNRLRSTPELTRDSALTALGLPRDLKTSVTLLANMRHPVKDHPTFLRAAKIVAAESADVTFLLAGEGELQSSFRALAHDLGIANRTIFLGRCQAISELLAISDVCVLSSRAEGFPNVILEYMGAGRPVVSTDVGGVREVIVDAETGFVVPVGDEREMAGRIAWLVHNPAEAVAMGVRGRQIVEDRFSCEAQMARVEDVYGALLADLSRKSESF